MRADPGGIQNIVNGTHFRVISKLYIDLTGTSNFVEVPAANVSYAAKLKNNNASVMTLGNETSTELTFDLLDNDATYGRFKENYNLYDKQVKLEIGFYGTSRVLVFLGKITNITEQDSTKTLHIMCRDIGGTDLQQRRISTPLKTYMRIDEWLEYVISTVAGMDFEKHGYGLFTIPFLWLDDEAVLEQAIEAAASEGGIVYAGEDGKIHYWPPFYLAIDSEHQSSQWTVTEDMCTNILVTSSRINQYDEVYVPFQPRYLGKVDNVFSLDRTLIIPNKYNGINGQVETTFRFDQPVCHITQVTFMALSADGRDMSDYIQFNNSSTPDIDDGYRYAEHWDMTIENTNENETIYLTQFDIDGIPVIGAADSEYKTDTAQVDRVYRLQTNFYVQTEEHAKALANMSKNRYITTPLATVQITGLKPNPLLELGDLITVQSSHLGLDADFYVTEIRYSLPNMEMQVGGIIASNMFDTSNYFVVGTSHLNNEDGKLAY